MTTTIEARPLRRDAAQNRTKILDAALVVFAHQGLEAGVEEIARVAGVGMGTLYRRFPTKQALIDELIGGARRDLVALARSCAQEVGGTGLEQFLMLAGQLQADRIGCQPDGRTPRGTVSSYDPGDCCPYGGCWRGCPCWPP